MDYSSLFVCLMGMGTVFFGLICLIVLTTLMSAICGRGHSPAAPVPAVPAAPPAPAEDRQALAAAIARLAGDPDTRRAWGRAAQARSGRYARQRVVPQVLGEYRQWLEGREGDG